MCYFISTASTLQYSCMPIIVDYTCIPRLVLQSKLENSSNNSTKHTATPAPLSHAIICKWHGYDMCFISAAIIWTVITISAQNRQLLAPLGERPCKTNLGFSTCATYCFGNYFLSSFCVVFKYWKFELWATLNCAWIQDEKIQYCAEMTLIMQFRYLFCTGMSRSNQNSLTIFDIKSDSSEWQKIKLALYYKGM